MAALLSSITIPAATIPNTNSRLSIPRPPDRIRLLPKPLHRRLPLRAVAASTGGEVETATLIGTHPPENEPRVGVLSKSFKLKPRKLLLSIGNDKPRFGYRISDHPILYEYALFAVDKFNTLKNQKLELVKIPAATTDTAAGFGCHLCLQVKEFGGGNDPSMFYRASVWKQIDGLLSLTNFEPVDPDDDPRSILSRPENNYQGPSIKMDESAIELVDKLAKFAVSTYNEEEDLNLQFGGAFRVDCREVILYRGGGGTMYSIYLNVLDNGMPKSYLALVFKEENGRLELGGFTAQSD